MTLVLTLICPEGIVLASDSAATADTAVETVLETKKIFKLTERIVWAASGFDCITGAVGARFEELAQANQLGGDKLKDIQSRLVKGAHEAADGIRGLWLPPIGDEKRQPPTGEFLVCGYHGQAAWVLEIHPDGTFVRRERDGFAAIGSGTVFAYFAMANLRRWELKLDTLDHTALVAFSIISDAIHAAPRWLSEPVKMCTLRKPPTDSSPPAIDELPGERIQGLGTTYAVWRRAQIAGIEKLFSGPQEPPVSLPEDPAKG